MKAHQFVDTFDTQRADLWQYAGPATVASGRLVLPLIEAGWDPAANGGLGAEVPAASISAVPVQLTGSRFVIEAVSVPTTARSSVSVTLADADEDNLGEFIEWSIEHGTLTALRYIDQVTATGWSAPFDPIAHRWLSIRHEPGVIVWSTSPDGVGWTDRAQLMTTLGVDAMHLAVSAYLRELANPEDDDGLDPAPALFDNANNPPVSLMGDDPLTEIVSDGNAPNLAIDVSIIDDETSSLVLDESELDGYAVLGWGDNPNGWVNIVCDVTRVQISRGTTGNLGPLAQTEAGTCAVQLTDIERRIDPTINGDVIHPGTGVRVRAWGGSDPAAPDWSTVLFTGKVSGDGIAVAYARVDPPVVTFTATDLVGELVRWESIGYGDPGIGAGDTLLTRVGRVLTEVGIENAISIGSDAAYLATLAPTRLERGWGAVSDAVTAELGRVWVDSQNRMVVRGRGSQLTGPVRGTLSDWHGESVEGAEQHCCYVDPSVRYSPEQLVNRVIGGRSGTGVAAPVQLDDDVSRTRHGLRAVRETALALASDTQVAPWAGSLISSHTEPRVRVDRVTPAPWGAPEAWQAVCSTDIGDRWLFRYHPQLGPTVREAVGVLGIEHEIDAEGWSIVWHTAWAPAPGQNPSGWFMLDVSELEGGDVLAPFS